MLSAFLILCVLALLIRSDIELSFTTRRGAAAVMRKITYGQRRVTRKIFSLARMLGGLRTDFRRFTGTLPPVFMIVSNHQSVADIPAIAITFPSHAVRFIAKKSLGRGIPYVSQNLRRGQSALISRTGEFKESQNELRRLAGLAREGICPLLFPEGTRSRTGQVHEFYTGAFRVMLERQPMPVLSVAVDGGSTISTMPKLLFHLRGACYRVKPLTLYPAPHGKKEIIELLARLKSEITGQVNEWREQERGKKKPIHV